MKMKDFILGVSALTIGISGALASTMDYPDIYIRQSVGGSIPCLDITDECDGAPGVTCRVNVFGLGTRVAYWQGCQTVVKHSTPYILPAELIEE